MGRASCRSIWVSPDETQMQDGSDRDAEGPGRAGSTRVGRCAGWPLLDSVLAGARRVGVRADRGSQEVPARRAVRPRPRRHRGRPRSRAPRRVPYVSPLQRLGWASRRRLSRPFRGSPQRHPRGVVGRKITSTTSGFSSTSGRPGMKPSSAPPITSTIGSGLESCRASALRPATATSSPAIGSSASLTVVSSRRSHAPSRSCSPPRWRS